MSRARLGGLRSGCHLRVRLRRKGAGDHRRCAQRDGASRHRVALGYPVADGARMDHSRRDDAGVSHGRPRRRDRSRCHERLLHDRVRELDGRNGLLRQRADEGAPRWRSRRAARGRIGGAGPGPRRQGCVLDGHARLARRAQSPDWRRRPHGGRRSRLRLRDRRQHSLLYEQPLRCAAPLGPVRWLGHERLGPGRFPHAESRPCLPARLRRRPAGRTPSPSMPRTSTGPVTVAATPVATERRSIASGTSAAR